VSIIISQYIFATNSFRIDILMKLSVKITPLDITLSPLFLYSTFNDTNMETVRTSQVVAYRTKQYRILKCNVLTDSYLTKLQAFWTSFLTDCKMWPLFEN